MPYKSEKMKLSPEQDRRIKISDNTKNEIIALKGKISQRKCAELFGISRRSVVFLWYPERLEQNKQRRQERGGWRQYYDKEKNTETQKEHRHYKQDIYLERRKTSWSHLFRSGDIFFAELDKKQIHAVHSYATSIGVKIKLSLGVWFDTKNEKASKLYKIEILERVPVNEITEYENEKKAEREAKKKAYRDEVEQRKLKRKNKKDKIIEMYLSGETMQKVADTIGCTKQYVSLVLCKERKKIL